MPTPKTKYIILPFIVLCMNGSLWLEGTIYKTQGSLFLISHGENFWRNIFRVLNSYLRGSTKRIDLEIRLNGQTHRVRSDKRGNFKLNLSCKEKDVVDLEQLKVFLVKKDRKMRLGIPEPFNHCYFTYTDSPIGVVSDIDDTVLVTHTLNTFRKMRTLLVKNALRRKAVKKMKDFYQEFHHRGYPFFYVSNSESNLFPMIRLFLEHNHFPIGPVFLKPYVEWSQIFEKRKRQETGLHKKEKITFLLNALPEMNFILIGDDSQKDPEIYAELAHTFPGRIREIYIRMVKHRVSSKRQILKSKVEESLDTNFIFFDDPEQILVRRVV